MKRYFIDADDLIKNIESHKAQMQGIVEDDYLYQKAHDHIIDIIEIMKKYAICLHTSND